MRVLIWLALVAGLAPGLPSAAAPLEEYGRLPSIERVSLSPDGEMLALAVTNGEQRRIVVQHTASQQIIATLDAGVQKVRGLQWAGSNHLIITVSRAGYVSGVESARGEWEVATDFNLQSGKQHPLISDIDVSPDQQFRAPPPDILTSIHGPPDIRFIGGHPFAFARGTVFINNGVNSLGQTALFQVDLDQGDRTTIANPGMVHTLDYVVDPKGKTLAEADFDAPSGRWTLRLWKGHWQEVQREEADFDLPELLGLGRDGGAILVASRKDGQDALRELSVDSQTWSDPLPTADPTRLVWDPATLRLIGASALVGDEERYTFFDAQDQAIWKGLTTAYPGASVSLASLSADHKKFVVRVDSPADGPAYALVDLGTGKGTWIGDEYLGLKPADIAPVKVIAFQAKDGLALTGYLTLPRGRDSKKLPLVVFPHGGPAERDDPGFNWWAQAMASRGYAVLQVNYRGSEGLGWDFQAAGFGQWGRKMQTDLSDGVRFLAAQGTIDPARVCIVGASYGGYAALAGATRDPGVYRCAVSVAGISDLRNFIAWGQSREGDQGAGLKRYWARYMGAEATVGEISPALHADNVTIPVLLIHGNDDTVVPYAQSQTMADALRKAGKPVEFVTLPHEDHWLSSGETRLRMLQATVAFLEKNNPPQ